MFRSMFARLFSMFLAVMLVVLGVVATLSYVTIRDNTINASLEELKQEAREMAYLASEAQWDVGKYLGIDTSLDQYIQWKAKNIYDKFGAYILIMDNQRHLVMDNLLSAYRADPDLAASLDSEEIVKALYTVMSGQEVQLKTTLGGTNGSPMFTVGVPWGNSVAVMGAVFIHTRAQVIEAEYQGLIWQVIAAMGIAALLAGLGVFWYTKSLTKPLTGMVKAAQRMAQGDFTQRADTSTLPELAELAVAFNTMGQQLSELEESRREFVANVSHELRSPMTSIQGFIQGMEDGTIPLEEHGRYLHIVQQEIKRLTKLINDLLSLSRLEQSEQGLQMKSFDMNELIRRGLIHRMNDIDHKRLTVSPEFELDKCMVYGDSDRIEQVVINLLDNAIKFTPEEGTICVSTKTEGDLVTVTVKDDGPGILPQDRDHVFSRFYTANKAHTAGKGTGLGLSICQRILEQHGQTIRLLDVSPGAAFAFTLKKGQDA